MTPSHPAGTPSLVWPMSTVSAWWPGPARPRRCSRRSWRSDPPSSHTQCRSSSRSLPTSSHREGESQDSPRTPYHHTPARPRRRLEAKVIRVLAGRPSPSRDEPSTSSWPVPPRRPQRPPPDGDEERDAHTRPPARCISGGGVPRVFEPESLGVGKPKLEDLLYRHHPLAARDRGGQAVQQGGLACLGTAREQSATLIPGTSHGKERVLTQHPAPEAPLGARVLRGTGARGDRWVRGFRVTTWRPLSPPGWIGAPALGRARRWRDLCERRSAWRGG